MHFLANITHFPSPIWPLYWYSEVGHIAVSPGPSTWRPNRHLNLNKAQTSLISTPTQLYTRPKPASSLLLHNCTMLRLAVFRIRNKYSSLLSVYF
jgi:hypothetical protein